MKSLKELIYDPDAECHYDLGPIGAARDVAQVLIYLAGGALVEKIVQLLFPNGLGWWDTLMVLASNAIFGMFMFAAIINAVRCLLKSIAKTRVEADRYIPAMLNRQPEPPKPKVVKGSKAARRKP